MKDLDRYPTLKKLIIANDEKRTEAHCYDQWVRGLEHLKRGVEDIRLAEQMVQSEEYVPEDVRHDLISNAGRLAESIRELEVAIMNLKSYDNPL